MFYIMYLTGLCTRRSWPQPHFTPHLTRQGWHCIVRVNSREYSTDAAYSTEDLARNAAATRAYMICRSFSVNDGMCPGQKPGQGALGMQGLPVAIGAGRAGARGREGSGSEEGEAWSSGASGGESPTSVDSWRSAGREERVWCCCRRAEVRARGSCGYCLRKQGVA